MCPQLNPLDQFSAKHIKILDLKLMKQRHGKTKSRDSPNRQLRLTCGTWTLQLEFCGLLMLTNLRLQITLSVKNSLNRVWVVNRLAWSELWFRSYSFGLKGSVAKICVTVVWTVRYLPHLQMHVTLSINVRWNRDFRSSNFEDLVCGSYPALSKKVINSLIILIEMWFGLP